MLTLEVFLASDCLSAPAAKSVAKKALQCVERMELVFRDEAADAAQARALGLIVYPAFVIGAEVLTVGIPSLDQLVNMLKEKIMQTSSA